MSSAHSRDRHRAGSFIITTSTTTEMYNNKKNNFKSFEKIVNINIIGTKRSYYHNTFRNYKNNMKKNLENNQ